MSLDEVVANAIGEPPTRMPVLGRGRKSAGENLVVVDTWEAEDEDILRLASTPVGATTPAILKIRDSHHSLARTLASGIPHFAASKITGFAPSRISVLLKMPAFQELMSYYRDRQEEIWVDMQERLKSLSTDTIEEIHERLHEEPEKFTNTQLLELLKATADRSGNGPTTTQRNVNVNLSGSELADLKAEAAGQAKVFDSSAEIIESRNVQTPTLAPRSEEDSDSERGTQVRAESPEDSSDDAQLSLFPQGATLSRSVVSVLDGSGTGEVSLVSDGYHSPNHNGDHSVRVQENGDSGRVASADSSVSTSATDSAARSTRKPLLNGE